MGAELSRERAGEKTKTGMNEDQLADFARKPVVKSEETYKLKCLHCGHKFEKPRTEHGYGLKCPKCGIPDAERDQEADPIKKSLVDRIDAFIEKAIKTEEEKLAEIERFRRHSGSTGRGNNERMRAREQGKLHKGDK